MILLEAMASETVVVASDIEGYHDDIQPLGPFQDLGDQALHVSGRFL